MTRLLFLVSLAAAVVPLAACVHSLAVACTQTPDGLRCEGGADLNTVGM